MKKLLCLLLALTLVIPCQIPALAAGEHTDSEATIVASVDDASAMELAEEFPTFDAYSYESESNNTTSTANYITVGGNYMYGQKNSSTDTYDYYKFYATSGYKYQVALVCKSSVISVSVLTPSGSTTGTTDYDYNGSSWTNTVDFTATTSGYHYIRVYTSSTVGADYMVGVWRASSSTTHTCSYTTYSSSVAATCTSQGYDIYKCSCGNTTKKNYVSAKGHTAGAAATCTTAQTCVTCGTTITSATGHSFPTSTSCTETRVCTTCGESVAASGHTAGTAATCTTAQTCTVCKEVLAPAKGHTAGAAATCTTAQTCTACGITLTSAKGHTPGAAATCSTAQTCTTCGSVVKAATGCVSDVTGFCTTCGKVVQGDGTLMTKPVTVTLGSTYTKIWTSSTDHLNHYVRFTVPERGIVTVNATKPSDSEGEYGVIKFTIYDVNGDPIMGNESYKAVDNAKSYYQINMGLEAGTYYMTMIPGFRVTSGLIETDYSVSFKATQYCEVEPNSSAKEATLLSQGHMFTGWFGGDGSDYEEHEYFKFDILNGHTYRITWDNFGDLTETSTLIKLLHNSDDYSIRWSLEDKVDSNGYNYYEFTAKKTETAYIQLQNYSGAQYEYGIKITDVSTGTHKFVSTVTSPTCISEGYTTHKCNGCGSSYKDTYVPATGVHTYEGSTSCKYCGYQYAGEIFVERIKGKTRYETSLEIAKATKEELGVAQFDTVIIASGTGFADALAGSYLAKVKDAPILMTNGKNNSDLVSYVSANLKEGGKIYILGGTAAVPQSTEDAMKGINKYDVERLKGKNRYATNIEILKEAGVTNEEIIVATGTNFADSLSASAVGLPILLVDGKGTLTADQKTYLASLGSDQFYVVGGTGAVSEAMKTQISAYGSVERVKGSTRYETSVAIAKKFFDDPETAVLAYAENYPDGLCGGPLAISLDAPLVLTKTGKEAVAKDYVTSEGIKYGKVLGGAALIDDNTAKNIFGVDIIGY